MNDFRKISTTQLWEAIEQNAKEAQRHTDWIEYLDNIRVLVALVDERIETFHRKERTEQLIRKHRGEFALGDGAEAEVGVELTPASPLAGAASGSGGDKSMDYKKALDIGHERADQAAEAIRRWTGVKAMAVCAVQPGRGKRDWKPVGQQSWKEIAQDNGFRGGGNFHLLVIDEDGAVKACSKDRFPLGEVLRLANRLPLPVAMPGRGQLSQRLDEEDLRTDATEHALHVEV